MSEHALPYDYGTDEIRSVEQNARFHAMVGDVAKQVQWAGDWMDEEDWKRLFLAALWGQKMVPNPIYPQAPFIVMNKRRSRSLVKPAMSDLIQAVQSFGDERNVKWGAP